MSQPPRCEQCGAPLPAGAMEGLCPRCTARMVFGESRAGGELPPQKPASATGDVPDRDTAIERPGMTIGRYKLLERIGEGGFGVVYMADQLEPVQRRVALKIVKAGRDTRQVIARFEAERQALALMDHPNIARVLDAGTTGTGRPYFVMELVKGIPITEFCDRQQLSLTERLELFLKVCRAVQHAHQKGIIHRDLKPSNVLVTLHDGTPVPKVIDFGVAKALGQKLTERTLFTAFAHLVGTPAYMSPEQAELSGLDVDTRSDIYSLGVLLYELLTGVTPFDKDALAKAALDEVRRMIRETEPARPSTRLRTLGNKLTEVASQRHIEAPKLIHFLRGDLDWIVMKCLEKDRRRRYETANALAMDVQRHQGNEPVVARPPTAGYRLQKLIRRHKLGFAAGGAVTAALVLGLGISTIALVREKTARKRAVTAEQEQARLRQQAEAARSQAEQAREHSERLLYAADMKSAFEALEDHELYETYRRLTNHWPQAGEPDLRGWEWRYLWQQCQSDELLTLGRHLSQNPATLGELRPAGALAFSPDGQLLVSGGGDWRLRIYDLSTTQKVQELPAHGEVLALAFSPDGGRLAVGSDRGVRLWNATTWQEQDEVPDTKGIRVESLCFTPDSHRLVAMNNQSLGVWQIEGKLEALHRVLPASGTGLGQQACAISPDGRKVVHVTWDYYPLFAKVWLRNLERHAGDPIWESRTEAVRTLALSPDGHWLALAMNIGPVEVHSLQDLAWPGRDPTASRTLDTTEVFALSFSPDGKLLAAGGRNGRIELWETATWRKRQTLIGHFLWITDIAFSPDTNASLLATTSADGTVRLWSTTPQEPVDLLPWPGNRPTYVYDPAMLTALIKDGEAGTYSLWDFPSRSIKSTHPLPSFASNAVQDGIGLGPGGRLVAVALKDRSIVLWDQAGNAGKGVERWRLPTRRRVGTLHFSPDGNLLFGLSIAIGQRRRMMWVWDVAAGREIASATNTNGWGNFLYLPRFTADHRQLAIFHNRAEVCLWDFAGSGEIIPFEGCHPGCMNLALAPDDTTVATVNWGGTLKLWDVASRREIAEIEGRGLPCSAVTFTPDGQRVITGSTEELKVLDVRTRRALGDLRGGSGSAGAGHLLFQDPDTLLVGTPKGIYRLHAPSFAEIEAAEAKRKIAEGSSR